MEEQKEIQIKKEALKRGMYLSEFIRYAVLKELKGGVKNGI